MITENRVAFRTYVCEDCGKESMIQIGLTVTCCECGSQNMTVKKRLQPTKPRREVIIFPEDSPFHVFKNNILPTYHKSANTANNDVIKDEDLYIAHHMPQEPVSKTKANSPKDNVKHLSFSQLNIKGEFTAFGISCRIENKSKYCAIWCKRSFLAFKTRGKIFSHQGKLYVAKLKKGKLSICNLQWNRINCSIGKRIIKVNQDTSNDLFQTLRNTDIENQIQDIIEGIKTEDCKVLINGKWYNNNGELLDEAPESSSNGDASVNQNDEFIETKTLDKGDYPEVDTFLSLRKNKKMKEIIELLESEEATKFGAVNFLRYLILSANEASLYTAFMLVGSSSICRRYFPQVFEKKDIEDAMKFIFHLPLLPTIREWLYRTQITKQCPFEVANKSNMSSITFEKFLQLFDVYKKNLSKSFKSNTKSLKSNTKSKKSKKHKEKENEDNQASIGLRRSFFMNIEPIKKDEKYTDLDYGLLDT